MRGARFLRRMGGGCLAALLAACLLFGGRAWAVVADAGTDNPFELGAGARALALSGAYAAVADDASALFWNPAGLSRMDQAEVTAMHISLFYDTPYDFLGAAVPLLDWGTFAVGAVRLATSGIQVRDADSYPIGDGNGTYDLREYQVGFGRELPFGLRAGTVVKVDAMRLLGDTATGVDLDLGLQFQYPEALGGWEKVQFGIDLQNVLATPMRMEEAADLLPLNVRVGLAYPWTFGSTLPQHLLITVGMDKSTWRSANLRAGLEYGFQDLFFLRGGLQSDAWTAGAGVQYGGLALDYALDGQELGLTHRFSLTYRFGPHLSEQREAREKKRLEELDREVVRRAEASLKAARADMDQQLKLSEKRFQKERQALLAKQDQRVSQAVAEERQRQSENHAKELEQAYFKSLHYFQGIKDFLAKRYVQAVTEFETVAKLDPNYLDLQFYLGRARQLASGQATVMNEAELDLYYQGINLYLENKYAAAIETWKRLLVKDPSNVLVLRNIEEAEGRLATIATLQSAPAEKAQPKTAAPAPGPNHGAPAPGPNHGAPAPGPTPAP